MSAQNQQRPDLEQVIRERQNAARQAMYASGSETEQSAPTDFAGIARRLSLLVLGFTGAVLIVLIAGAFIGGFAHFVFSALDVSGNMVDLAAGVVVTVFLVASIVVAILSMHLVLDQVGRWIKTGRAS